MSKGTSLAIIVALTALISNIALVADDEVPLFNGKGGAAAYIAVGDEMTVYLWNGKPVAYLEPDKGGGGFHVYGFNGKHLGWFVQGVIRNHEGDASCAVKERLQSTESEPYKSYKEYKPYKDYKEYAPYRPAFSESFGAVTCSVFLSEGAK
jgi:hypothetical protein